MRYLITIMLLCCAALLGCSREDMTADALQWHPSKITCPDDTWDPQHGYTLSRIEDGNGHEVCTTDVVRVAAATATPSTVQESIQEPHAIDWKDCEKVTDQWKPQVERFNAEHAKAADGLEIRAGCMYSNPGPKQPERKIALTAKETAHLHELRRASDKAFSAQSRYEAALLKAHGVVKPDYGDPCFHFVGIIFNEDAITIDPNAMMPGCNEN